MRVYISADIEGVAGVVSPAQCQAGHAEHEKARLLMTHEVNAVIEGLLEGGATATVSDVAVRTMLPGDESYGDLGEHADQAEHKH